MTAPTWQQQKSKARKQAAVIVPAVALTIGLCCVGVNMLPDEPRPGGDTPPTATADPDPARSVEVFDPPEDGSPTAGPTDVPAPTVPAVPKPPPGPEPEPPPPDDEPDEDVYYANCAAARRAGAAPIRRGEPGYRRGLDRDGDGVACDR
jgi:hypothetical protein